MQTKKFKISGMKCGGCVENVKKILKDFDSVADVEIKLDEEIANVSFQDDLVSLEEMKTALAKEGFGLTTT